MSKATFEAKFDVLDEIREFVADIARNAGFSDKEIYAIKLAADEASTNVIEHAYAGCDDGRIEIECSVSKEELKIIIRDKGRSFDPTEVLEPNLNAKLSERKIGGLGMYLMRKIMDEVSYQTSAETGNILVMTKRKGNST